MTVYQRTKKDAKRAAKTAKIGDELWTIAEIAEIALIEDARLCVRHKVTRTHPIFGTPMICGSLSVELLVLRDGPVYTSRPAGLRAMHEPAPQVSGPLDGQVRALTPGEIKRLEQRVGKRQAKKILEEAGVR